MNNLQKNRILCDLEDEMKKILHSNNLPHKDIPLRRKSFKSFIWYSVMCYIGKHEYIDISSKDHPSPIMLECKHCNFIKR